MRLTVTCTGKYNDTQKQQIKKIREDINKIKKTFESQTKHKKKILDYVAKDRKKYRALRVAGTPVPEKLKNKLRTAGKLVKAINDDTKPKRDKLKPLNEKIKAIRKAAGFIVKPRKKKPHKDFKPVPVDKPVAKPKADPKSKKIGVYDLHGNRKKRKVSEAAKKAKKQVHKQLASKLNSLSESEQTALQKKLKKEPLFSRFKSFFKGKFDVPKWTKAIMADDKYKELAKVALTLLIS